MTSSNAPKQVISFIVALSFFMEALDSTVINTAIPAMSRSLMVDPIDLKVALISYLLSLAVFIPISGWLADKFGSKRIFLIALITFTLSSLACGFADNLITLVVARFIQGFGGALSLPVGRLILVRTYGREHLITVMNNVIMVGAIGIMLGPVVGGMITHYFSWHWIFWVNIPVGIFAIILANHYLTENKLESVPPLDKLGFVLFGSSLAGLTFGLSALSETAMPLYTVLSIIGISLLLLVGYALHSHTQNHPIVKTDLLRIRTFRVSVMGNLMARLGFGGVPFITPLFLQIALQFQAQQAGLLLAPIAVGILLGKPFTLRFLRWLGYKHFLILNTLLASLSIFAFALITNHTPVYIIGCFTFVYGFVLTLQYGAMNSLAYADLVPEDLSAATSIMSTLQQVAMSFGVAITALLIHLFVSLFSADSTLTTHVFHYTFLGLGFLTLASTGIFFQLAKDDGQQMLLSPSTTTP